MKVVSAPHRPVPINAQIAGWRHLEAMTTTSARMKAPTVLTENRPWKRAGRRRPDQCGGVAGITYAAAHENRDMMSIRNVGQTAA
jgi:hypothetical protein